jgi:hypothetical protein
MRPFENRTSDKRVLNKIQDIQRLVKGKSLNVFKSVNDSLISVLFAQSTITATISQGSDYEDNAIATSCPETSSSLPKTQRKPRIPIQSHSYHGRTSPK